jgi:signal transduction histidine kinase
MSLGGLRTRLLLMALAALVPVLAVALIDPRPSRLVLVAVGLGAMALVLVGAEVLIVRPVRALSAPADEMADTLQARQGEIERSTRERRRLLAQLVAAEEEERKRIAGDIHDDSIQALAALLLRLELLEGSLEDDGHRRALVEAREATRDAVARLRHLVFKLSPPALETAGLGPALSGYLDEITRVWGPETELDDLLGSDPSVEVRALTYRIAVEAVNNAAKHGQAERIDVSIAGQDGGVRVRVRDDGTGFDAGADAGPAHYGLRNMRERAQAAGGWCRVQSAPGAGTTVEFLVPDDRPPDER